MENSRNMSENPYGRILLGRENEIRAGYERFAAQPVDQEMMDDVPGDREWRQTTIGKSVSVTGPGTFFGRAQRKLEFEPTAAKGWWLDRTDIEDSMPIEVSVKDVWTTARNIVLCSGSPHNYVRMVEHIVALKYMGLDNVMIRLDSGDPPLFERSSMDLVEAIEEAGIISQPDLAEYVTVKETVTVGGGNGSFLTFHPAEEGSRRLTVDCAIDFPNAIGKQRIRFDVNNRTFRHGAFARTNTNMWVMLYCKTIGRIFADVRHLGYTLKNILVAGPRRYVNKPHMIHDGKSLEAVWHRAVLDLLAAVALIDRGRFAGHIVSHRAGHALDVNMIKELYQQNMLVEV